MRSTGHIRQRSAGSWELRYSLGRDEATGKRRIVTTTVRGDRKAAEKELRRLLHAVDTGAHVDPSRLTVRQWLAAWLAVVREEVSPKSHERYAEIAQHFLIPALGNLPLTKLTPSHIQTAYNGLATGGRRDGKEGGLSPRTRRHIHRILNSALARAVEQQVLARNPADAFKKRLPKVERREMTTLSTDQAARLLASIKHTRVYWPVLLALSTGMRRGEVFALRWRNVDLDHGSLRVMESLEQTKAGIRFKAPKTERARAITLPSFVIEELRRLKRQQSEELLMLGVRQTGDTLVCARADGEPLQPQSLTHQFTRLICRIKDLPRVRFHDLRHSHATQLLLAGVHPKIAQERLGHATITTTLDLYSHVTQSMQRDAAERLDAVFRSAITRSADANPSAPVANTVANAVPIKR
jgi:integrase